MSDKNQMISLKINDTEYEVPQGYTILQACEEVGVTVPRFCYHERLSIAGNCRMCLVEVAKSPKLVVSCAMPAAPGSEIWTDTPAVRKGREGVLEFLLINHPLDCPICDQGGECDLQDQAMVFGSDRGRFQELKRAVEDKDIGPLIKTIMTRCIHCTRCIRFASEIAGVADLGTTGRGNAMEIGTYVQKLFHSELSGNVIDLCPVGALTSKPYAFTARPWELKSYESIDTSDALGSNIRIDARGMEILRILPRSNSSLNFDWISDKARFQYDGFNNQRVMSPMVHNAVDCENNQSLTSGFKDITWSQSLSTIKSFISLSHLKNFIKNNGAKDNQTSANYVKGSIGKLADLNSIIAFDTFLSELGHNLKTNKNIDFRTSYLFSTTLKGIEDSDLCLLIGTNPRREATLLNVHLRERFLQGSFVLANIGSPLDLSYPIENLGNSTKALLDLVEGRSNFCQKLLKAQKPIVIIGQGVFTRQDYNTIDLMMTKLNQFVPALEVNILHHNASSVAELDVGCYSEKLDNQDSLQQLNLIWGERSLPRSQDNFTGQVTSKKDLNVFIGHNALPVSMDNFDTLLPSSNNTEKVGVYVNTEGRTQKTSVVNTASGLIRKDWEIFEALRETLKGFGEAASEVVTEKKLEQRRSVLVPHTQQSWKDCLSTFEIQRDMASKCKGSLLKDAYGILNISILDTFIQDFYRTDQISANSATMAKCAQQLSSHGSSFRK